MLFSSISVLDVLLMLQHNTSVCVCPAVQAFLHMPIMYLYAKFLTYTLWSWISSRAY